MKKRDTAIFNGLEVTILEKKKGGKAGKANIQSGIFTGFKSKPCTYLLSNGLSVRGDKLRKI